MSPPLISDYKRFFAVKRVCQTFFGGPKLFSHPIPIVVQVFLFTLPALILSIVDLVELSQDFQWRAIVVGVTLTLTDFFINFFSFLLKRGHQNIAPSDSTHHFLEEEDQNDYDGFFKASTWIFIAPNTSLGILQIFSIFLTTSSFALCTPLVFSRATLGVLRGLAIFALCVARYSSVINLTPEVSNFDPIKKTAIRLYRPFYTFIIGASYFGTLLLCEDPVDSFYFTLALSLLPFLWVFGILPPVDALIPWALETILRLFGGVPSNYYFGTVLGIFLGVICAILALVAAGQNAVLLLILECFFGYIISCDIGTVLNIRTTFCEDVPAKTAIAQLVKPFLAVLTSTVCIIVVIVTEINIPYKEGLSSATLTIALSSWIIRGVLIGRNEPPPKAVVLLYAVWDGILTYILHIWLTIQFTGDTMRQENSTRSLVDLFEYMLTIRAYSLAVFLPKLTSVDVIIASFYYDFVPEGWTGYKFVFVVFFISLARQRILRLLRFLQMIGIFVHSFFTTPLLDNKGVLSLVALAGLPVSLASLVTVTMMEGCTLVPVFTLPIFLVAFPRPVSFWKEKWFPYSTSSKEITRSAVEGKTLDWTIYSQIAPLLTRDLVRKAQKAKLRLEEGQSFIARYEDRLIFLRIVSSGWNFVYVQVRGLEMQEQTSCHHQEAAWIDEIFEKAFGDRRSCSAMGFPSNIRNTLFGTIKPQMTLMVSTYAESKSTLANLRSKEEIRIFQSMFYRAFSYLWIKKNPVFKGESYQRPIASGYHFIPPGGATVIAISDGSFDDKDFFDEEDHHEHGNHQKRHTNGVRDFSMSKALFSATMANVNAMLPGSAVAPRHPVPTSNGSTREAWSNGLMFPHLPDGSETPDSMHRTSSVELNSIWVRKCVGEAIPSNAVKNRVEKLCYKAWHAIMGSEEDLVEVDLCQFFSEDFWSTARKVARLNSLGKISVEEITVKALRYASKLTLDEIYSGGMDDILNDHDEAKEEEIFYELTLYEKNHKFCTPKDIQVHIDDRQKHIVSMQKTEDGATQMRLFNFEALGVEFRVGKVSQFCVEGIWGNLNLELLYLTSDDDERFSIQHDRYLMRNIFTQCAHSPLGYAVYDGTFKVSLFDRRINLVS
ncbi:unnamed protein product [Allacma fusca]|uniref:Pecanex-like protein n=1 Tax=Allacma fusca TaxID=39272 RepID=A0A8J2Q556_9HEXA|nr:unnamed protein product [Allacma fusca]